MYAIIDVAGHQFKVEKGQKIFVHRLENEEGSDISLDKVLLIDNDDKVTIGEPLINGAFVEGKVLEHKKGDKIIVFKKKRRKGYKVKNGHRQQFSHLEILSINATGAKKKTAAKAEPVAKETKVDKPEAKKADTTTKTETKPVAKKVSTEEKKKTVASAKTETKAAAPKKATATKKPVAKTTAVKKTTAAKKTTTTKPKATPKKKADGDAKK